jgi:DnaD/phage-associated family protein
MAKYIVDLSRLSDSEAFGEASKEELRVLLSLLSNEGEAKDFADLAKRAKTSKARAMAALVYWQEANVLSETEEEKSATHASEKLTLEYAPRDDGEEASLDVAREIKDKGLASLLGECARLMGKPMLSTSEAKKIVSVYVKYALDEEFIITLAAFLAEQKRLTAARLEAYAENLAKQGVDCTEELEIYIAKKSNESSAEYEYRHFFRIYNRPLSSDDKERAERWFLTYGFSEEIVGLAYSITTTNKGALEFAYMDSILAGWHESGCKTVEDCKAENEKFKGEWKANNLQKSDTPQTSRKKTKEKPRYGEFDVADAFAKALERSYGEDKS